MFLFHSCTESFYVANVVGNRTSKVDGISIGDWYLVNPRSGECRVIADVISRDYLVFKAHLNVYNITSLGLFRHSHTSFNQFRVKNGVREAHCHHIGSPLPSFILSERTPDDIVLKHMVLFEAIQG